VNTYLYGGGVAVNGDTDWALAIALALTIFSVNVCAALARARHLESSENCFRETRTWALLFLPYFLTLIGSCYGHAPLILRDVPVLGRYPSRAGEGRIPTPTVPSTRIKGEHICIWGGGTDGVTDRALALAVYFSFFSMSVSVALARGRRVFRECFP
jgi:hypothetical protein